MFIDISIDNPMNENDNCYDSDCNNRKSQKITRVLSMIMIVSIVAMIVIKATITITTAMITPVVPQMTTQP